MKTEITLGIVEKELKKLRMKRGTDEYVVGLILLGAMAVGANADSISTFIGQPRKVVRTIGKRLRDNGIWIGTKTMGEEWFEKDGGIAFVLDCAVGMGYLEKKEVDA